MSNESVVDLAYRSLGKAVMDGDEKQIDYWKAYVDGAFAQFREDAESRANIEEV